MHVSGMSTSEDPARRHLTWVDEIPMTPGGTLEVEFVEDGATSAEGKTLEELFPGERPVVPEDFKPSDEVHAELRRRPTAFEAFRPRFQSVTLGSVDVCTAPDKHGFSFSVLWNCYEAESARVSVHIYTLESVQRRGPMAHHVVGRVRAGERMTFQVEPAGRVVPRPEP